MYAGDGEAFFGGLFPGSIEFELTCDGGLAYFRRPLEIRTYRGCKSSRACENAGATLRLALSSVATTSQAVVGGVVGLAVKFTLFPLESEMMRG